MTGTLFVRVDGTSCGASMVKRSADFASEASRCQRILSEHHTIFDPRVIGGLLSSGAISKLFALPLAYPGTPSVKSKWKEPTLIYERIDLRAEGRRFRRAEVIVDHEPAPMSQQVAIAIQVAAHVIVRIKSTRRSLSGRQAKIRSCRFNPSWAPRAENGE